MPHALGKFPVHLFASESEREVLARADEFRAAYCALQQERHQRTIDLRNAAFPALWQSLVEYEAIGARIYDLEKAIKALHAEERNRNVRTEEQVEQLTALRKRRDEAAARVKIGKRNWLHFLAVQACWINSLADWKNIKTLAKRREAYAAIKPPDSLALEFAWEAREDKLCAAKPERERREFPVVNPAAADLYRQIDLDLDIRERELGIAFQERGLHSAIRAEIIEASQPKLGKDKPGIRYRYGRKPEIQPWRKITLQFAGGMPVDKLLAGECPSLSLEPADGDFYRIKQQIGTAKKPRVIEYLARIDRQFSGMVNRWSIVYAEFGKRRIVPIMAEAKEARAHSPGVLHYDLTWTIRKAGVQVCRFWSERINETLMLPNELIARRIRHHESQQECDLKANAFLAKSSRRPFAGKVQGFEALAAYCHEYREDTEAENLRWRLDRVLKNTLRTSQRAARCIEEIYKVVAKRVCERHDSIVHDEISLAGVKRYDTRDLLKDDKLPPKSRTILQAVAPGKLREALKGYGLPASGEVAQPETPPNTDVFSFWILSLGNRSQSHAGVTTA